MSDLELLYLTTLAKICTGEDFWNSHSVEDLEVPAITMGDGPNGLRKQTEHADHLGIHNSIPAICYPTGSALASSFDRALVEKFGILLGEECRAEGIHLLLAPSINIKRTPLCGRNFEYFSEDPYLTGELAYFYIKGVQSQGVGACVKHFLANNQENGRMTLSANISKRALHEIYLPGFKRAMDANPQAVMSSYNRINGTYVGESPYFLTEILRNQWHFNGMVVSDWYAVNDRVKSIQAGLDLEMPGGPAASAQKLIDAVVDGTLSLETLETSANRITRTAQTLYKSPTLLYDKDQHHFEAVEIAKECAVLLKNENNFLPISKKERVLFIAETYDFPIQGGGSSHVNPFKTADFTSQFKGFDITFLTYQKEDDIEEILALSKGFDKVLIAATQSDMESEGYDRNHMYLAELPTFLITTLAQGGCRVGAVLFTGSAVMIPFVQDVQAILTMHLAGEGCMEACAALLTGQAIPSGRLSESYPVELEHNPAFLHSMRMDDVDYNEGVFVGYRYYSTKKIKPQFPFGYGLSYTEFHYSNLYILSTEDSFDVSVDVKNIGKYAAKEVIQLYITPPTSSIDRPCVELKGFEKIHLNRNERKTIHFHLTKKDFAYFDETINDFFTETGTYIIHISKSSENPILSTKIHVTGDTPILALNDNTPLFALYRHPKTFAYINQLLSGFCKDELSKNMTLNAPLRLVKGAAHLDDAGYMQFKEKLLNLLKG